MIDSVLKDVRDAEEKAEIMQKQAYQHGKEIVLKAEAEAEAQKKSAVKECKEERAHILQEARRRAEERTQAILADGGKRAEEMAGEKNSAVEDCADRVVDILIQKYIPTDSGLQ